MKLALISLTLCCIYVSISQQQLFMPRRYPLPFYYNSYYDSPQLSRNNLMRPSGPLFVVRNNYVQPYSQPSFDNEQIPVVQNQMMDDDDNDSDYYTSDDDLNMNEEALARVPFRGLKKKVVDDKDARFFFLSSSYNFLSLFRTSTSTTFIFTTVTSTLTSASIQTCAAAAQFISTTACRRRRYLEEVDAIKQDRIAVSPTQVLPMEASVAPPLIREERDLLNGPSAAAEVESSQQINDQEDTISHRQKRSFLKKYIVVTSSSTVTITSYSISASTVTKSITLGIGGCAACVSCLPSGVTIC